MQGRGDGIKIPCKNKCLARGESLSLQLDKRGKPDRQGVDGGRGGRNLSHFSDVNNLTVSQK